jgi:hypothetical protein
VVQRWIAIISMACALMLLGAKAHGLLVEYRHQRSFEHSFKPNQPIRFKINLREVLIDDRGTSLATFGSQGHRQMCVVPADLRAAEASKACSKEPDAAIVSVCLTGKCPASGSDGIPAIIAGGLHTLGWVCAAVRQRGLLFIDKQGNCLAP